MIYPPWYPAYPGGYIMESSKGPLGRGITAFRALST